MRCRPKNPGTMNHTRPIRHDKATEVADPRPVARLMQHQRQRRGTAHKRINYAVTQQGTLTGDTRHSLQYSSQTQKIIDQCMAVLPRFCLLCCLCVPWFHTHPSRPSVTFDVVHVNVQHIRKALDHSTSLAAITVTRIHCVILHFLSLLICMFLVPAE